MIERFEGSGRQMDYTSGLQSQFMHSLRQADLGDDFWMFSFKIANCPYSYRHNWAVCPYAHVGETARRRDPRTHRYTPEMCPYIKAGGMCPNGVNCQLAHNLFEMWLHPSRYRVQLCYFGQNCTRATCFFAHGIQELRQPDPNWAPVTQHPSRPGKSRVTASVVPAAHVPPQPAWPPNLAPTNTPGHVVFMPPAPLDQQQVQVVDTVQPQWYQSMAPQGVQQVVLAPAEGMSQGAAQGVILQTGQGASMSYMSPNTMPTAPGTTIVQIQPSALGAQYSQFPAPHQAPKAPRGHPQQAGVSQVPGGLTSSAGLLTSVVPVSYTVLGEDSSVPSGQLSRQASGVPQRATPGLLQPTAQHTSGEDLTQLLQSLALGGQPGGSSNAVDDVAQQAQQPMVGYSLGELTQLLQQVQNTGQPQ